MADQQVPREAKLVSLLLSSSGIGECEPKVIQQILELMYRYVTDVLQDGLVYAEHAGKSEIDLEDLRLAIKNQLKHMFIQPPSRDFLLELAARKNAIPLPSFEDKLTLRLPPEQHTLLGASYRITSQRQAMKSAAGNVQGLVPAIPETDAAIAMRAMMGMEDYQPASKHNRQQ